MNEVAPMVEEVNRAKAQLHYAIGKIYKIFQLCRIGWVSLNNELHNWGVVGENKVDACKSQHHPKYIRETRKVLGNYKLYMKC